MRQKRISSPAVCGSLLGLDGHGANGSARAIRLHYRGCNGSGLYIGGNRRAAVAPAIVTATSNDSKEATEMSEHWRPPRPGHGGRAAGGSIRRALERARCRPAPADDRRALDARTGRRSSSRRRRSARSPRAPGSAWRPRSRRGDTPSSRRGRQRPTSSGSGPRGSASGGATTPTGSATSSSSTGRRSPRTARCSAVGLVFLVLAADGRIRARLRVHRALGVRHRSHDLPWRLTMYPTIHVFGRCGDAIATADA